jgi:hypothetical protein
MNAAELRIGNWVKYKNEERIKPERRGLEIKVTVDDILALTEGFDVVEPIPLTEEKLIMVGFLKIGNRGLDFSYKDKFFVTLFPDGNNSVFMSMGRLNELAELKIEQYPIASNVELHRLQNIIHSLTGEELLNTDLNAK